LPVQIGAKLARLCRKKLVLRSHRSLAFCKNCGEGGQSQYVLRKCRAWAANRGDDASTKYALKGLTAFSVPLLPRPLYSPLLGLGFTRFVDADAGFGSVDDAAGASLDEAWHDVAAVALDETIESSIGPASSSSSSGSPPFLLLDLLDTRSRFAYGLI
jgi:hypothetical protein